MGVDWNTLRPNSPKKKTRAPSLTWCGFSSWTRFELSPPPQALTQATVLQGFLLEIDDCFLNLGAECRQLDLSTQDVSIHITGLGCVSTIKLLTSPSLMQLM